MVHPKTNIFTYFHSHYLVLFNVIPRNSAVLELRVILVGELFVQIFDIFFAQFFNLPYFPAFSPPNIGMLTNLIFLLLLENFTNSDRTSPYIDTYLQLFSNFGKLGKNALRQE